MVPPSPSSYAQFLRRLLDAMSSDEASYHALAEWVAGANERFGDQEEGFVLNYLAKAPIIRCPAREDGQGWQLPDTISRRKSMPMRAALTSAHLRSYVDAWLESGRNADGSESPAQRDLRRAPDALDDLRSYLEQAPAGLIPSIGPSGFDLVISIAEPTAYSGRARDFFEAQAIEAKRLFVGIIASDWKGRLCKCRYRRCGRYFLHPKPRQCYRHGTFCSPHHAMGAGAERSIRMSRAKGSETLVDEAARLLCEWKIGSPGWLVDVALKRRLAGELCSVIARMNLHRYRDEVKMNWVTHHQAIIERKRFEFFQTREPS